MTTASVGGRRPVPPPEPKVPRSNRGWRIDLRKTMRLTLPALLLTIACANPKRDLAQCKVVVGGTPGRLAACLVSQHNWNPDTATQAELAYDADIRAYLMRLHAESAWVADTMVSEYRRYMHG